MKHFEQYLYIISTIFITSLMLHIAIISPSKFHSLGAVAWFAILVNNTINLREKSKEDDKCDKS